MNIENSDSSKSRNWFERGLSFGLWLKELRDVRHKNRHACVRVAIAQYTVGECKY